MIPGSVSAANATVARLQTERRLLAVLFRWPRLVDLEPRHFVAPAHAALFDALQEVQRTWPVESLVDDRGYDDIGLALIAWCLERDQLLHFFRWVGGVRRFVIEDLMRIEMPAPDEDDLATMVELVRACPRCGK